METFTPFQPLGLALGTKKHDLATDQLVVALSNVAPNASDDTLSDITEISYTNCSTRDLVTTSFTQTGGTASLVLEDLVLTATGGDIPEFRYVIVYNDDATNDDLIGYIDYGSAVNVTENNTFTIDLTQAQTLFDITQ
jgi:hypothetical protein